MVLRAFLVLLAFLLINSGLAASLIPPQATWIFFKGYTEASSPDADSWREPDFDDSSWNRGAAPFYYETQPTSGTAVTGNTELSDMNGRYNCVFLRHHMVITNPSDVASLSLIARSDDGFVAWLNGTELARQNMPLGDISNTSFASVAAPEPAPWSTNSPQDLSFLRPGTNVLCIQAFNSSRTSSDFLIQPHLEYEMDLTPPSIASIFPTPGVQLRELTAVEIAFTEPVTGVSRDDLLLNGQPATNLLVISPYQFVFVYPPAPPGNAHFAWISNHQIRDLTSFGNAFVAGPFSYNVNPSMPQENLILTEFMAANSGDQADSVLDELGNVVDWIEVFNSSQGPVDLGGWFLTDDPARLDKWRFPAVTLPQSSFLLVMASGRATNVAGQLHTSFKISAVGGYLALVDPEGTIVSSFSPTYPRQYTDVSYGRDIMLPELTGYYTNSTPGTWNADRGDGFLPEVRFSRRSGVFITDFLLELSSPETNCEIRYLVVTTNVPSGSMAVTNIPSRFSTLYTGPILVNRPMQVRVRAFPKTPGLLPGPPQTECFIKISPSVLSFSSDLPTLLLHNLGGGSLPSLYDQEAIAMLFEPFNGVVSFTNPPTLVSRVGINKRGRSTGGLPQASMALEIWDEYNRDRHVEFLGMPAESDWVFYAQNGFDSSFLHNPLAHRLARNMERYSPRTRFAEVFLNTAGGVMTYASPAAGHYYGLYTVEEKVKRSSDRVDIKRLDPVHTDATNITGGYLLKIDEPDPNERTFYDSAIAKSVIYQDPPGLEMVTPARAPQAAYISSYFKSFGTALWGSQYTNSSTGYVAYIDTPSWIDNHILNTVLFNVDAFRLSSFFYKNRGGKLEMGPLWDFDRSLGTHYSGDTRAFDPRVWRAQSGDGGTDFFTTIRWWERLCTDPNFWQQWIDRWAELRLSTWTDTNVFKVVDSLASEVRRAHPRETVRWTSTRPRSGTLSAGTYTHAFPGTYQGEIDFLKKWLKDRFHFIDTNFLAAPVLSHTGGLVSVDSVVSLTHWPQPAGTIVYYTLDGTDPRLPGGGIRPGISSTVGTAAITIRSNILLFARSYNPNHRNLTVTQGTGNPRISSPWSAPIKEPFYTNPPPLVITEIMYHPGESGVYSSSDFEFIELKNRGSSPLNLAGFNLSGTVDFTFHPTNGASPLKAGGYVVIVKNRAAFVSRYPLVTNIAGTFTGSLGNSDGRLRLTGPLQEPIEDIRYADDWFPITDGFGFSLVPISEVAPLPEFSAASAWRPSSAVGGSPGHQDPAPTTLARLVISEALTHTDLPQVDTVEILNQGPGIANLGGWFLSDDPEQPRKYTFPSGTRLSEGQRMLVTETEFGSGTSGFGLSSLGDQIYLFSGNGTNLTGYYHGFEYGAQVNGRSFGLVVTSDAAEHFVAQTGISLGQENHGALVPPVVLNEICYAPPPLGSNANYLEEFIEIRNTTAQPVPLCHPAFPEHSWKIMNGVSFTFPRGTELPPYGYAVIVSFDPHQDEVAANWFYRRYGIPATIPLYGPFEGQLANEGESIGLYFPDNPQQAPSPNPGYVPYVLAESVHYIPFKPWPDARENGNSIGRYDPRTFAGDPTNWVAGSPTPGRANAFALVLDTDADTLPDEWETLMGLNPRDAAAAEGCNGDPDQDGVSNWFEYLAGSNPLDAFSRFEIIQLGTTGGILQFQFPTAVGRLYRVERLLINVPGAQWTPVTQSLVGTGNLQLYQEYLGSEPSVYRVTAWLRP